MLRVASSPVALVVQKFGGTSVADPDRMRAVADHIARTKRRGNEVSWSSAPWARRPTTSSASPREVSATPGPAARWTCSSPPASARPWPCCAWPCTTWASTPSRSPAARPASSPTPPTPTPRSSRCGPTASATPSTPGHVPVVGGVAGRVHRPRRHLPRSGRLRHHRRRPGPRARRRHLRALHRRVRRVHHRSPGRVRRPQDGPGQLRRAARDDGQRLPQAGHALGRVRPHPRGRPRTSARRSRGSRARSSTRRTPTWSRPSSRRSCTTPTRPRSPSPACPTTPASPAGCSGRWPTRDINVDLIVQNTSEQGAHRHLLHRAPRRGRDVARRCARAWPPRSAPPSVTRRHRHRPGERGRRRHEVQPGRGRHRVRDAGRGRDQHRDDLDVGHPDQLRGPPRTRSRRPCRCCTTPSSWPSASALRLIGGRRGRMTRFLLRRSRTATLDAHDDRNRRRHRPGRRRHAGRAGRAPVPRRASCACSRPAVRPVAACTWGDGEVEVEDADTADWSGLDIALFSAGGATSKALAPRVAEAGAIVIDNSSAWRMDPEVPLVVPEVNAHALDDIPQEHRRQPQLHDHGGHAGAQAARPRGRAAHARSSAPTRRSRAAAWPARPSSTSRSARSATAPRRWPCPARRSTSRRPTSSRPRSPTTSSRSPGRSSTTACDETDEEQKLRNETRKILELPDLAVSRHRACGCRSTPVTRCRSTPASPSRSRPSRPAGSLIKAPGVELADVPTPLDGGRRRPHLRGPHPGRPDPSSTACRCSSSGDNLRKGAALNAVQIAEALLERRFRN